MRQKKKIALEIAAKIASVNGPLNKSFGNLTAISNKVKLTHF
jgi:hypothetical protein